MSLKTIYGSLSKAVNSPFQHRNEPGLQDSPDPLVQQRDRHFLFVGQTHVGLVRPSNQDAFFINVDSGVFIVADGMGGHSAGEVASRMAVDVTAGILQKYSKELKEHVESASDEGTRQVLEDAFGAANKAVYLASRENPLLAGMGTTLIIAWIRGLKCYLGHVGDVRGYLFREGALQQLTRDHSTVATLVETGQLTPKEAREHPLRHQIERAVGPFPHVNADIATLELRKGDIILLCTDGLWDMVQDQEIAFVLENQKVIERTCEALMNRALSSGGKDNVTLVIVEAR